MQKNVIRQAPTQDKVETKTKGTNLTIKFWDLILGETDWDARKVNNVQQGMDMGFCLDSKNGKMVSKGIN